MLQMIHSEDDVHRTRVSGTSHPFTATAHASDGKLHLLLAASGSVATIKIPNILSALSHHSNLSICVILTRSATNFLQGQSTEQPHIDTLNRYANVQGVFLDEEEWVHPWKRGQSILHIELRRWAHMLVVAPLSANTLAKITGGFSDNLLTSVVRAWDTTGELEVPAQNGTDTEKLFKGKKRIIVAPAMNTAMWRHPITKSQIKILEQEWGIVPDGEELGIGTDGEEGPRWFEVLRPQEKELACGDIGDGAMRDWKEIIVMARQAEHQKGHLTAHRRSGDQKEAHAAKSKTSRIKTYKVSKVLSPPKNLRERTKKSVIVKPIAKNDVWKLQHVDKHARSSQISKHVHVVEPSSEPDNLTVAFHESLEEARTHILNTGKAAFDEVHAVLIQKLADKKAKDRSFLENNFNNATALGAPLAGEKIQTTVQHKNRRVSEIVEIGKQVDHFNQTIEDEEKKLEEYWKQYESLQSEFVKLAAQVFGGEAVGECDEDEGYRNDIKLLDTQYATQINTLLEGVNEVGDEAIKKMKASEKEIDGKTDKVRQKFMTAMFW
ncbi:hypothetical protein SBOR_2101 [Sclerotinia borealis F-4128]|uniref:Flavoprotein domain-containing protein n=1 Tax=Sclerotinia borealis (strain F-4128) TaxID=1432307 RepID=W9CSI7_SCLBF|nr:hypothetical protein SBOR_2101 [Sclerotinia borealis F-4128]